VRMRALEVVVTDIFCMCVWLVLTGSWMEVGVGIGGLASCQSMRTTVEVRHLDGAY
jgi:hypothetical protein